MGEFPPPADSQSVTTSITPYHLLSSALPSRNKLWRSFVIIQKGLEEEDMLQSHFQLSLSAANLKKSFSGKVR